jgi:hypothetical protein
MGDQSCGVQIPGTDAVGDKRSANTTSGPDKGKGKIASSGSAAKAGSRSSSSNIEALSEEIVPLERKRRLVRGDGFAVGGPSLSGQQTPKKAATLQPDPKAAVMMVSSRSNGGRSVVTVKEATAVAMAKKAASTSVAKEVVAAKHAAEAKAAEEATAAKAAEEATMVKATEEAMAAKAAKEVEATMAVEEAMAAKAPDEATAVTWTDSSSGEGPGVMQTEARRAPDVMLDLKVVGKRTATMTGSSGSSRPRKRFCGAWRYATHFFVGSFFFLPILCTSFLILASML